MKKLNNFIAVVFSLILSFTNAQERVIEKEFQINPGEKLILDFETGMSIKIKGWDKDVVKAEIYLDGRDSENIEIDFDQSNSAVVVTSEYMGRRDNYRGRADSYFMVPAKFNIDLNTMGGGVEIDNVEGDIEGQTMGGSLDLSNLKGHLDLQTMGGGISLTDSKVDGKVHTMGGSVDVENVEGDVSASSMGGNVRHKNVKSSSKSVGEEVDISTMGGSIDVDEALHGANVKTMGGAIKVNKVHKFLKAETMGGDITVRELDGWVKAKTMGGDIYVKMVGDPNKGERDVELTSMSGDIELYVPKGMSMRFDLELVYDEDDEGEFDIISDFPIDKEVEESRGRNHWNDSLTMYGTGEVNGGKNSIRIKTINGDIIINYF
ncbi:MAG: hypothetical protein PVH88_01100 [Ignavibacteria bacterium]|jgi:DUF4097 and DUF4098 domain-containing protein YvlB